MKKSFKALALTFFVILSVALIAMGTSAASLPGDVNGDGEVNIRDAAMILQYVTGYDVQLVAPCTHTGNVVIDPEVAPTYDQSGLTVGVHCTKCGEILIPQETVPPLGHTHTEAILPAVPATCQAEGLTEGKYCSVCNAVLLKQQPTPKTDHELGDWEAYGSYTVRRCIKSEDCDVALRVKSITATYNGDRLLTGEQVWKSDISVTVTLSDNTSFTATSKQFTLENDVMTVDGNNVVTVKFVNSSTTVTVPAIHGNLPGTNPASDFEYSGADKDAITITKYIGTSSEVVIPAHIDRIPVRYIGDSAFSENKTIQSVTIPGSILSIGSNAFYNCIGLRTLNLNEGLTSIGERAFMYSAISSLTIPDSVTTIKLYYKSYPRDTYYGAFEGCKNLTEVVIGSGLTYIDAYTFCNCTALKSVVIGESVSTIYSNAFDGCSALIDIDFGTGVHTIASYAFRGCTALTELELGSSIHTIGNYAFTNCSGLKSINFSSSVQTIGEGAFIGCNSLAILNLNEGLQTIKGRAFMGCPIVSLTIPDSVTTIESYYDSYPSEVYYGAFENCKNLTEVVIGSGLTYIDANAFRNCTALKSVVIGESVSTIYSNAFDGCSALIDIDFGTGVHTIASYAFRGCTALTELELGSSIHTIGNYAFSNCSDLKSINFSSSVQTIGNFAFQNCTSLPSANIPSNVQTIGEGAFIGCNSLEILNLSEGLKTIKGRAFMGCPIVSLTIPDSVTTIESYYDSYPSEVYYGAFEGCKSLQSVVIGSGLTTIARETFAGCSALENVVIGSSVHTISDYAFSNCTALVTINIPDNVTTIGSNAFKGCTLLENFRLGTGVQSIGASALQDCTSIDTVTIPANVQVIGNNAFTGCVELDETVIEKGALQSIGSNAYSGCSDFDRIYYTGTESDWERITVNSTNVYPLTETPYYYSATAPAVSGNYWYYNSNGDKRVWKLNQVSFKAEEYSEDFAYAEFGSEETSYSNQYLKELKSDSWLQAGIAVWEGLNTVTDFDSKKITKKHVYKLVIYDLLMGEVGSNVNPLACMEEACDSYIFEYAEFILEDEIADLETLKYLNPALYDEAGFIDKFFKGVDGAEFIFQTTSNLYDALYTCAQYQALSDMDENFYLVLIEISKDSSLPSDLRNAAKECANCYQTASKGMLAKVIAKEFAASTMEDLWLEYAEVAWEAVITSIFPQYKVVEMTVKGVMFLANAGFNLDARNEAYYQLEAAVGLENALRKVIKNTLPDYLRDDLTDKSEYYLYAIEMYQTSVLLGFDYSSSLLSEFSKGLDVNASERQEYAATISKLGQMKTSKKQTYNNFDQSIEQLFVEYYAY